MRAGCNAGEKSQEHRLESEERVANRRVNVGYKLLERLTCRRGRDIDVFTVDATPAAEA